MVGLGQKSILGPDGARHRRVRSRWQLLVLLLLLLQLLLLVNQVQVGRGEDGRLSQHP